MTTQTESDYRMGQRVCWVEAGGRVRRPHDPLAREQVGLRALGQ